MPEKTRKWQSVESSNIDAFAYDAEKKELFTRFTNGSVYKYDAVPESVYKTLISAESVGRTFNSLVKPSYKYSKVS